MGGLIEEMKRKPKILVISGTLIFICSIPMVLIFGQSNIIISLSGPVLGLALLIFGILEFRKRNELREHRILLGICILILLISVSLTGVYVSRFDVIYRVTIDVYPDEFREYRIIIPLPADGDGKIEFEEQYGSYQSKVIETEYGKGLEISGRESFELEFDGRAGNFIFEQYSLSDSNHTFNKGLNTDYCLFYLDKMGNENSFDIHLGYSNHDNYQEKAYDIDMELNEEGWYVYYNTPSGWII